MSSYRYLSPENALKKLAHYDPDVSNAVFAFIANCNTEWYFSVRKLDGTIDASGYKKLKKILNQWNYYYNEDGTWDSYDTIDSVINGLVKLAVVRGGVAAELVLDAKRQPVNLAVIDPTRVKFKQKKPGIYTPLMRDNKTNKDVELNMPTFFYEVLVPEAEDPYAYSPIASVLETIFFSLEVVRDLDKMIKAAGFPKFDVKVLVDVLVKNAPINVRTNADKLAVYVKEKYDQIVTEMKAQKPEDAFVHFDTVEISRLESKSGAVVDFRPIIQILDQRISSALKTLPAILGRTIKSGAGGGEKTEAMLYVKNVKVFQKFIASTLSKIFTLILRLNGSKSYAQFHFAKVSLRSDEEVENHRKMLQSRLIEAVKLGWINDNEACLELYHNLPDQESGIFGMYLQLENPNPPLTQDPLAFGTSPTESGDSGSGQDRRNTSTDIVDNGGEPTPTGEVTGS